MSEKMSEKTQDARESNLRMDKIYIFTEVRKDGTRAIALIGNEDDETAGKMAAVTPFAEIAEALLGSFQEAANKTGRQFILTEYAKVQDLVGIAKR